MHVPNFMGSFVFINAFSFWTYHVLMIWVGLPLIGISAALFTVVAGARSESDPTISVALAPPSNPNAKLASLKAISARFGQHFNEFL